MELRGTFRDFSLEAILGLIRNGYKTGTLHLAVTMPLGMTRRIDLSFLDGEIASVRCGRLHGVDALREAAICVEGSFEFGIDNELSPQEEAIPVAMEVALATIDEARNEMKLLTAALPAAGTVFCRSVSPDETVHLSVEEFRLLAVTHDGMTLSELVAANSSSAVDSLRIVRQLLERGLVSPDKTSEGVGGIPETTG